MPTRVLVTGASGHVGRQVVRALNERGIAPIVTHRPGTPGGAASVPLDFHDPDTFAAAVAGCDALFLLRPPAIARTRTTLNVLIDAARAAGVGQIVFLSVAGAESRSYVPHHAVERHLRAGPQGWTILRPGFFAQNFESAYREDIMADDRLYVPAGGGQVAFVDLRDVGDLAATVLLDPARHAGQAYTLTGPVTTTFGEAAAILSEVAGRGIRYDSASAPGYWLHLRRRGLGFGHALVQTVLHVGLRRGQAAAVDPTLERLLGRRPRDLARYLQDHADLWGRCAPDHHTRQVGL